jgi:hypothetical protein
MELFVLCTVLKPDYYILGFLVDERLFRFFKLYFSKITLVYGMFLVESYPPEIN